MNRARGIRVYISASIVNGPKNRRIHDFLTEAGCQVFLPQTITKQDIPHEEYPIHVYESCIQQMEQADIGIIVLDCFGRDSSWECGWFTAKGKTMVGWVEASLHWRQDWMIKSGLSGVVTTDDKLMDVLRSDPIIGSKPLRSVSDPQQLADFLAGLVLHGPT